MPLISLIVTVVVLVVAIWAVLYLMEQFATPPQIRAIVLVLIVLVFTVYLLRALGVAPLPLR